MKKLMMLTAICTLAGCTQAQIDNATADVSAVGPALVKVGGAIFTTAALAACSAQKLANAAGAIAALTGHQDAAQGAATASAALGNGCVWQSVAPALPGAS